MNRPQLNVVVFFFSNTVDIPLKFKKVTEHQPLQLLKISMTEMVSN